VLAPYAQSEEVKKITTYYPSPYGNYQSVKLVPIAYGGLGGVACLFGEEGMIVNNQSDGLIYCDGSQWQALGAGAAGGGNWTLNETPVPDALHPNEDAWNVGIGTTTPIVKLQVEGGAMMAYCSTTPDSCAGVTPASGLGTRFMWIPSKAAFRAGYVMTDDWDEDHIGDYSFSVGYRDTEAKGKYSVSMGRMTSTGTSLNLRGGAVALGYKAKATANYSTAMGMNSCASDIASTSLGQATTSCAFGDASTVLSGKAAHNYAVAIGYNADAALNYSVAFGCGNGARTHNYYSMAIGLVDMSATETYSRCQSLAPNQLRICGDVYVTGTTNDTSGKVFKILHPDPSKSKGTYLKHTMLESPTAGDNLYRWTVEVINRKAIINLPDYYNFLNKDDMVWVYPVEHFGSAYGVVDKNQEILTVYADSDGEYNVLLIGTRKDKYATDSWQGPEIYIEPSS